MPLRLDPARPVLVVTGERTQAAAVIDVRGPAGEPLGRLESAAGPFEARIALDPLIARSRAPYAVLTFEAGGLSPDPTRGDPARIWRWGAAALARP